MEMRGPKPPEVKLSEEERIELEKLARARKSEQQIAQRAEIILLLSEGHNAMHVAALLDTTRKRVRLWRKYWFERSDEPVEKRLYDAERSGSPGKFKAEQWVAITALACTSPEESGRPIGYWTERELADEAIKRGIVDSISPRQVGRFLKSGRFKAAQVPILAQRKAG